MSVPPTSVPLTDPSKTILSNLIADGSKEPSKIERLHSKANADRQTVGPKRKKPSNAKNLGKDIAVFREPEKLKEVKQEDAPADNVKPSAKNPALLSKISGIVGKQAAAKGIDSSKGYKPSPTPRPKTPPPEAPRPSLPKSSAKPAAEASLQTPEKTKKLDNLLDDLDAFANRPPSQPATPIAGQKTINPTTPAPAQTPAAEDSKDASSTAPATDASKEKRTTVQEEPVGPTPDPTPAPEIKPDDETPAPPSRPVSPSLSAKEPPKQDDKAAKNAKTAGKVNATVKNKGIFSLLGSCFGLILKGLVTLFTMARRICLPTKN